MKLRGKETIDFFLFFLSIFNAECPPFMHALIYPAFHNCRAICRASRVSAPSRFGIDLDLNKRPLRFYPLVAPLLTRQK
jgi:hypothetical protein